MTVSSHPDLDEEDDYEHVYVELKLDFSHDNSSDEITDEVILKKFAQITCSEKEMEKVQVRNQAKDYLEISYSTKQSPNMWR